MPTKAQIAKAYRKHLAKVGGKPYSLSHKVSGFKRKAHARAKPGGTKKVVKISATKVKSYSRRIPKHYKK